MGGLYNMALGDGKEHSRLAVVLTVLGETDDPYGFTGRFRDAWIEKQPDGPPRMAIYTRNGGGNRDDQAPAITRMQGHPLYLSDRDDNYDSTYATFYFAVPAECDHPALQPWAETRQTILDMAWDPVDTDQRWQDAIAALR